MFFCFAEHLEKATYGLEHKLTLTGNTDNAVLNKDNAINNAEIEIIAIQWYVPLYTPSIPQQTTVSEQILSKTPTELQYVERFVFMNEVGSQNLRTFELGTQEGIIVPIWIIVGSQQTKKSRFTEF